MPYGPLASLVVVVHFAFVGYVALGGALVAYRRWTALLHVPALIWAIGIVTIGMPCPLTYLENWLREQAGQGRYTGGFVDRYIEDVVYPDEYTGVARVAVAALVLATYAWAWRRRSSAASTIRSNGTLASTAPLH